MTTRTRTWSAPGAPPGRQAAANAGVGGRLLRRAFHLLLDLRFSRKPYSVIQVRRSGRSQLVFANEHGGRKIALGLHERRELQFLRDEVKPADHCVDVGAYMGHFTNMFAAAAPRGSVLAIEPIPQNAWLITLNAAINGDAHVRVVCGAATAEARRVALERAVEDSGFSRVQTGAVPGEGDAVEGSTVDALTRGRPVDIVKIDVEGYELEVLRGMVETLGDEDRRPRLLLAELVPEYLAHYGASVADVFSLLERFGYRARIFGSGGQLVGATPAEVGAGANVVFDHAGDTRRAPS